MKLEGDGMCHATRGENKVRFYPNRRSRDRTFPPPPIPATLPPAPYPGPKPRDSFEFRHPFNLGSLLESFYPFARAWEFSPAADGATLRENAACMYIYIARVHRGGGTME